jgi:hypothetical protein
MRAEFNPVGARASSMSVSNVGLEQRAEQMKIKAHCHLMVDTPPPRHGYHCCRAMFANEAEHRCIVLCRYTITNCFALYIFKIEISIVVIISSILMNLLGKDLFVVVKLMTSTSVSR